MTVLVDAPTVPVDSPLYTVDGVLMGDPIDISYLTATYKPVLGLSATYKPVISLRGTP